MYRFSAPPSSLDLLIPQHLAHQSTHFDLGCRKEASSHKIQNNYSSSAVLRKDGLHTPPFDDMASTAFQQPSYGSYVSRQDGGAYSGTATYSSVTTLPRPHPADYQSSRSSSVHSTIDSSRSYKIGASPRDSSQNTSTYQSESNSQRKNSSSDMIIPKLQIPSSVSDSGGSIAEFAAQITCLFWFESTETLRKAENYSPSHSPVKRLDQLAIPSTGFRKWVVSILSTTQVTQNVILLALLFIYRLKTTNPTVQGRMGSEFRLLTVALMLGNKFLDDNTYTNKTWAEVSGIPVGEIHVMEVEFLGNMRYSLFASKEEWKEWQIKLGKFCDYFDKASRVPLALPSPIPSNLQYPSLPSPPVLQTSPPTLATSSSAPPTVAFNQQYSQYTPLPSVPELDLPRRKRSFDDDGADVPAKRVARTTPLSQVQTALTPVPVSVAQPMVMAPVTTGPRQSIPRLPPVPQLSISTSQPLSNTYPPTSSAYGPNMNQLPPIPNRAMASIQPPVTPTWSTQISIPTPGHGIAGSHSAHSSVYSTPSRRQSPGSAHLAIGSSPTSATFPLNHHSPSIFLQQRSSPYKPVRHVNTLLYPPPSGGMYPAAPTLDQMHYQPLGKRKNYRSGIVPEFATQPTYQNWPILPQPNFHS